MRDHRGEFSVEMMANILGVSKSGFYAWVSRPESGRVIDRRLLDVRVKACFEANHARYGSLKISRALAAQGHQYCRPRVADSMRRQGLRSKVQRKFVITTDTKHTLRVAPNLLDRMFDVETPNSVWVSDITYLPCRVAVSGCLCGSILTADRRMVCLHKPPTRNSPHGPVTRRVSSPSPTGSADPFRPGHPILLRWLPRGDRYAPFCAKHEQKGQLLG